MALPKGWFPQLVFSDAGASSEVCIVDVTVEKTEIRFANMTNCSSVNN